MSLQVSTNRRFLIHDEGAPFFYLADTAWELFHRLTRSEAEFYLQARAAQGFTVIMASVLAEHGFDQPGPGGHLPLHDNDPARPNALYFEHVDWVVRRANGLGLSVAMLTACWFDPRTGQSQAPWRIARAAALSFVPPAGGQDWVLVLDDAARNYPPPGTISA